MSEDTRIVGNGSDYVDLTEPEDATRTPIVRPGAKYVVTANNLGGLPQYRFARGDKISASDLQPGVDEAREAELVAMGAWLPLDTPVKRKYTRRETPIETGQSFAEGA